MKKKNVLLMIQQLTNGGAEHSIIRLANELKEFYNVYIFSLQDDKPDYDCHVPIIYYKKKHSFLGKFDKIFYIKNIKKKYNIDVTISYMTINNFLNVASKYKDKTIISIRNHMSTKKDELKYEIMSKIVLRKCDYVVCCAESIKSDEIKNYNANIEKVKVINNFCSLEEINKLLSKNKKRIDDKTFTLMSRIIPHKAIFHVIKSFKLVKEKYNDARLLIFGRENDLTYLNKMKEYVKKNKMENNIVFMGFNNNPYSYIKDSKALILASNYEGFPNTIIEAMSCGTPVIATDSPGGAKEILSDDYDVDERINDIQMADYGVLVPTFMNDKDDEEITTNEEKLAEVIIKFIEDKKLYDRYHKKSLVRIKKYDKDEIIKQWIEIIDD